MTCDHCAELEERVAWLESELGLQRDADSHQRLREVIGRRGGYGRVQTVELVLALYRAKGRTVTRQQLLEAVPSPFGNERADKIVDVWVCHARHHLGRDAIQNIWGKGYRITPAGISRVSAILAPRQVAA